MERWAKIIRTALVGTVIIFAFATVQAAQAPAAQNKADSNSTLIKKPDANSVTKTSTPQNTDPNSSKSAQVASTAPQSSQQKSASAAQNKSEPNSAALRKSDANSVGIMPTLQKKIDANAVSKPAVPQKVDVNPTGKMPVPQKAEPNAIKLAGLDVNSVREKLAKSRQWALACAALVGEAGCGRYDVMLGCELNDQTIAVMKEFLVREWGIRTRADLLKMLSFIEDKGYRARFESLGKSLVPLDDALFVTIVEKNVKEPERVNMMRMARRYYGELGDKGLIGWDYSRYIGLCRLGYAIGFLTEDEAWAKIMPAAKLVQAKFSSWQELAHNYMIGAWFWDYTDLAADSGSLEDAYWRLFDMPSSPWNTLDWKTSLAETKK
jgi:hypothetical protein